eukprot:g2594.t1
MARASHVLWSELDEGTARLGSAKLEQIDDVLARLAAYFEKTPASVLLPNLLSAKAGGGGNAIEQAAGITGQPGDPPSQQNEQQGPNRVGVSTLFYILTAKMTAAQGERAESFLTDWLVQKLILQQNNLFCVRALLQALRPYLQTQKAHPKAKATALKMLSMLALGSVEKPLLQDIIACELCNLIPLTVSLCQDLKCRKEAEEVLRLLISCCQSDDILKARRSSALSSNRPVSDLKTGTAAELKTDPNNVVEQIVKACVNQHPKKDLPTAIEALASCLFVQEVKAPALAVMVPVLQKAIHRNYSSRDETVLRRACVIIENMAKMVPGPGPGMDGFPLVVHVYELLHDRLDSVTDPEVRDKAEQTLLLMEGRLNVNPVDSAKVVLSGSGRQSVGSGQAERKRRGPALDVMKALESHAPHAAKKLAQATKKMSPGASSGNNQNNPLSQEFVCESVLSLVACKSEHSAELQKQWGILAGAGFLHLKEHELKVLTKSLSQDFQRQFGDSDTPEFLQEDTDLKTDLFRGSFSLAFGSQVILKDTPLLLKQNRFYGLIGANGCGKTAWMRAVAGEKLDNFPKRDKLKTVFVEHDIFERKVWYTLPVGASVEMSEKGSKRLSMIHRMTLTTDLTGLQWVHYTVTETHKGGFESEQFSLEQIAKILKADMGFTDEMLGKNWTTYSGGWKLKMQLSAAAIADAELLLLDDPTSHLDADNEKWLKNWLQTFLKKPGKSIIVCSHNFPWVKEMATDVIFFDAKQQTMRQVSGGGGSATKGKTGTGDPLLEFATRFPKKWKELSDSTAAFSDTNAKENGMMSFPQPGPLYGVQSKTKEVLKMKNVVFAYGGAGGGGAGGQVNRRIVVNDVSLSLCLKSRVAVKGANGAGKSTLMRLLLDELQPGSGSIVRHQGLRIASVAQQALVHLESHLEKTAFKYLQWRFEGLMDKEMGLLRAGAGVAGIGTKGSGGGGPAMQEGDGKITTFVVVPGEDGTPQVRTSAPGNKTKKEVVLKVLEITDRRKKFLEKGQPAIYEYSCVCAEVEKKVWVKREVLAICGYDNLAVREDEKQV